MLYITNIRNEVSLYIGIYIHMGICEYIQTMQQQWKGILPCCPKGNDVYCSVKYKVESLCYYCKAGISRSPDRNIFTHIGCVCCDDVHIRATHPCIAFLTIVNVMVGMCAMLLLEQTKFLNLVMHFTFLICPSPQSVLVSDISGENFGVDMKGVRIPAKRMKKFSGNTVVRRCWLVLVADEVSFLEERTYQTGYGGILWEHPCLKRSQEWCRFVGFRIWDWILLRQCLEVLDCGQQSVPTTALVT